MNAIFIILAIGIALILLACRSSRLQHGFVVTQIFGWVGSVIVFIALISIPQTAREERFIRLLTNSNYYDKVITTNVTYHTNFIKKIK